MVGVLGDAVIWALALTTVAVAGPWLVMSGALPALLCWRWDF